MKRIFPRKSILKTLSLLLCSLPVILLAATCSRGEAEDNAYILLEDSGRYYLISSNENEASRDKRIDADDDVGVLFGIFKDDANGHAQYIGENFIAITPSGKRLTINEERGSDYIVERGNLYSESGEGTEISDGQLRRAWYHYDSDTLVLQKSLGNKVRCHVSSQGNELERIDFGDYCYPIFDHEAIVVGGAKTVNVFSLKGEELFEIDAIDSVNDYKFNLAIVDDGKVAVITRDSTREATELVWQNNDGDIKEIAEDDRVRILDSVSNSKWVVYETENIVEGVELHVTDGSQDELLGSGLEVQANMSPDGSVLLYSVLGESKEFFEIYIVELNSDVGDPQKIYEASRPEEIIDQSLVWIAYPNSQLAKIWISSTEMSDNLNAAWLTDGEIIDLTGTAGDNKVYPFDNMWISYSFQTDEESEYTLIELFDKSGVTDDAQIEESTILQARPMENGGLAIEIEYYEDNFEQIKLVIKDGDGFEFIDALEADEIDTWYVIDNQIFAVLVESAGRTEVVTLEYGDMDFIEIEDRDWSIHSIFDPGADLRIVDASAYFSTLSTITGINSAADNQTNEEFERRVPFFDDFEGFDEYLDDEFFGDLDDFIDVFYSGSDSEFCDQYYDVPGYSSYASDFCSTTSATTIAPVPATTIPVITLDPTVGDSVPFFDDFEGFDDYLDDEFFGDLDYFIDVFYSGSDSEFCDQYYDVPGYSSYASDFCSTTPETTIPVITLDPTVDDSVPFFDDFEGFDDYLDDEFSGDLDYFIDVFYSGSDSEFCDQYYDVPGYSSYASDFCSTLNSITEVVLPSSVSDDFTL